MTSVPALFFWFSGVLSLSIPAAISNTVKRKGNPADPFSFEIRLQPLYEKLSLGLIDGSEFSRKICNELQLPIEPEAFEDAFLASIEPNQLVIEIIKRIPDQFQPWLIVDYPAAWFGQMTISMEILRLFPMEKILFSPECGLNRISPDIFMWLTSRINKTMENCLLIDSNSRRVIEALIYGLPSAIFVDARRLEREFFLRKIITNK